MVDGIGPITGSMFGPLGLDVGDLKNSHFDWKTVSKGKRSRKSVGRNSSGLSKVPSESPVRVVDFSGSDSEKYVETLCVPLKKRRHILWAPSPPPSHASLLNADQLPLQHIPASDDFSGIALLADTACNDSTEPDKAKKSGDMESPSSVLRRCHTFVPSMQLRDSALCSGQKDVLHLDVNKKASYADQTGGDDDSPFGAADFDSSEVDTQHQDMYTLMEACKENEASYKRILKEKMHMNEEYASTDNDGGSTSVYTIPNHSEHQMGILEVTVLENSERKNDNTINQWPENGITETSYTVVETCGTKSEGVVTSDKKLISDSEVRTVCNLQESIQTKTNVIDGGSNKELDDGMENIETEGKNVPVRVDELVSSMAVEKVDSSDKRKCPFDIAVSRMEETGSKIISDKWKSCTDGWHTSGRFGKVGISRSDRENGSDRHATRITRYGSPLHKYRQTEGNRLLDHPGSRHGNHFRPRGKVHQQSRYQIGDCIGRYQENYQPLEGIRQPFSKRRSSPHKRFDFHEANTKVTNIRSNRRERSSENGSGGYFREEYVKLVVEDDVERSVHTRRVDRTRGSFQKPKLSASYEEDFVSSPKGQFPHAPRGKRFVRETVFLTHPAKHQKQPRDVFRQDQKLTDTRNLSRRFPTVSSRDELYEHCNNGSKTYGMRYSDKRHSRFEDGHRKGQRKFAGDYGERPLSPTLNRSRWANESNLVTGPSSRYTRSPMGGGGGEFRQTERSVGLSGQRKSSDYSTTRNTTKYVER